MHVPLSQLDLFLTGLPEPKILADALVSMGHEVEAVMLSSALGDKVCCGQIQSSQPHPQEKNLTVYQVQVLDQVLPVVSRVATLAEHSYVAVVLCGGKIGSQCVEPRSFGEVTSAAVFVSAEQLDLLYGQHYQHHEGILVFQGMTTTGPLDAVLGLDDVIFDVRPTPNRGDCLSVLGLARELAAGLDLSWSNPYWSTASLGEVSSTDLTSEFPALSLCATEQVGTAYYSLAAVNLPSSGDWASTPSPQWLQTCLRKFNQKPISLLVDLTNYFLYVYGQPMHVFDRDKIQGSVQVRSSLAGEVFLALDGQSIELTPGTLVIADQEKIIALAGVFGGSRAMLDATTRQIVFECAIFLPDSIRGAGARYQMSTESAFRFERGVDPNNGARCLKECLHLLQELIPVAEVVGVCEYRSAHSLQSASIEFKLNKLNEYVGFSPEKAFIDKTLTALGIKLSQDDGQTSILNPPPWRYDLSEGVCIIEELVRMGLLDQIVPRIGFSGSQLDPQTLQTTKTTSWHRRHQARLDWISRGFAEVCNYSFIAREDDRALFDLLDKNDSFPPLGGDHSECVTTSSGMAEDPSSVISLENPLSEQMEVLRRSLLPGLCRSLLFHLNRQFTDVRLVELGSLFGQRTDKIVQSQVLGGLLYGDDWPEQWGQAKQESDFYTLLGLVDNHLRQSVMNTSIDKLASRHGFLHPMQSLDLWLGDRCVGYLGRLHPKVCQHFELPEKVFVFEIDTSVYDFHQPTTAVDQYATVPHIRRDLNFLMPLNIPASRLLTEISFFQPKNLKKVLIFDIYTGQKIDSNYKSVSLLLIFGQKTTSLLDSEIDESCQALIDHIQAKLGVELRRQ